MSAAVVEELEFADLAEDQMCEGAAHHGGPAKATWLDIRVCGCTIAKCDDCADDVRCDFEIEKVWYDRYCGARMGNDLLGNLVRLVRYP